MDRLVWISLLLSYLPVTESMTKDESCLSQPNRVMRQSGQNALLKCTVNSHCSDNGLHYEWLAFGENVHLRLKSSRKYLKYSLDGASLNINSLHVNDSGIYYCAAVSSGKPAPNAQHVGLGTTLVVKEQHKVMIRHILWVSFVLLAIYSLALVILMIKKYGWNMSVCRRGPKTNKKIPAKKAQFRDVLQELYSRRNFGQRQNKREQQTVLTLRLQARSSRTQLMTSIKMSRCHKRILNDSDLHPPY